ncbi:hypothetical protein Lser_V15G22773 [Lactuca serriola]
MIPNTERRRKPLLLTTKTSPPSIFTLTDALRSHHLRSSTIMAINDLEHREEEKASADDEDIGAQVVPIVRLEAIEVINGEENEDAILDLVKILEIASTGMATLSPSSPPSSPFITIIGSLESNCGKRISRFRSGVIVTTSMEKKKKKEEEVWIWIWMENKKVMTTAVERAIALINPIFIEDKSLFDNNAKLVATISEISSPQELEQL